MIRSLARGACIAAVLFAAAAVAAPSVPGEPSHQPKAATAASLRLDPEARKSSAAAEAAVALPAISDEELAAMRASNRAEGAAFKSAVARRVNIGIARDVAAKSPGGGLRELAWRAVPGGQAAQVAVTSPGAASLRVALDLGDAPDTAEILFKGTGDRVEGPLRVANVRDRTRPWWGPITIGETQTVELFVPQGSDAPAALRVASVAHLFVDPATGLEKRVADIGLAGSCNVDIACSPLAGSAAFQQAVESVAQMVFVEGGFTTLCTSTLLADSDANSQVPWLFTANHCFENISAPYKTPAQMQAVADSVTTLWGFQAMSCGGRTPRSDWAQVGGGATWLYNDPRSDAIFLRLNGTPPGYAFYAGWDAATLGSGTSVTTVHFPQGDLKKVSQGTLLGLATLPDPGPGGGSFAQVQWSSGTTEAGSSGAPLFSANGSQYLVRGALWGGAAACDNPGGADDFSRFDQVYGNLVPWLGTGASAPGPTRDYTDLWWGGAAENGWGLNLIQHPSRIVFGVWYTYDAAGQRTWFSFSNGTWTAADTYEGTLYAASGPSQAGAFDPNAVVRSPVGNFTLAFSDADNGVFRFNVNGQAGAKAITRFRF
jgi:lysyl endopeptidase